jgi:hypothetical protein
MIYYLSDVSCILHIQHAAGHPTSTSPRMDLLFNKGNLYGKVISLQSTLKVS